MGKFDGILIATDLDATLLCHDKSISPENLSAIEYFKENGGIFTFITGRSIIVVGHIYDILKPNAPVGCFNGGAIYDGEKGEFISRNTLPDEAMDLVRLVDEKMPDMAIELCTYENSYFCKTNPSMERHIKSAGYRDLRCHYSEVKGPLAKALFAHTDGDKLGELRALFEKEPISEKFQFVRSFYEYLEMLPKGLDKGGHLIEIAKIKGIDIKRTIGIGDNDNDISLIKKAGVGVAVSNATDNAKNVADIVTVSNEESAIAKIIEDLDNGKITFEV